jgi:outer membrane protein assembly factor BamD
VTPLGCFGYKAVASSHAFGAAVETVPPQRSLPLSFPRLAACPAPLIRIAVLGLAVMLAGCQSPGLGGLFGGDRDTEAEAQEPETPAPALYNQALTYLHAGELGKAVEAFEEVDRQHPYSEYARRATIMAAFANFRRGRYDDAVSAAERFLQLYPGSDDAAYAHYIIGESYFRQVPDITRDQEATENALRQMQTIIDNYPESEYADDARLKVIATRDQLAGKEMQIGRYYLERREYIAAINRFKVVVSDYQTTRHVEEALARLVESYYAMGLQSEAQTAAAILGHNFPDSEWYKDSFALLQSGGLEPREDKGSWLSGIWERIT